jgi:4-hydroxybenzoate polyprenyltransferase
VSHLWCFFLPAAAGETAVSWRLWMGALYITIPCGLLIYGWNDVRDADIDGANARKRDPATAAFFGPSLSPAQLRNLPRIIVLTQVPFALGWGLSGSLGLVGWMGLLVLANALYNGPGVQLSRVPVLAEINAVVVYALLVWLGRVTHSPTMPAWCWAFAALAIAGLQIAGALIDHHPDRVTGKRTLPVAVGTAAAWEFLALLSLAKAMLTAALGGGGAASLVAAAPAMAAVARLRLPGWRRSTTMYVLLVAVDWAWLVLVAWQAGGAT